MAVGSASSSAQQRRSLTAGVIRRGFILLIVLLMALLLSIVVEWTGLVFFWSEQGIEHSEQMVRSELAFLGAATRVNPFITDPLLPVRSMLSLIDERLRGPAMNLADQVNLEWVWVALASAINICQVFALRLMVMLLSTPTFFVFGLVGLVRGLVAREIRRWGVGRESSSMYGLYMRLLPESFIGLWFLYLSMPFSLNPFYVVGPAAMLFSVLVANSSYRFKKYR